MHEADVVSIGEEGIVDLTVAKGVCYVIMGYSCGEAFEFRTLWSLMVKGGGSVYRKLPRLP